MTSFLRYVSAELCKIVLKFYGRFVYSVAYCEFKWNFWYLSLGFSLGLGFSISPFKSTLIFALMFCIKSLFSGGAVRDIREPLSLH